VTARFYDDAGTLIGDGLDNWLNLERGRAEFDAMGFGVDDPERITEYKLSVDWTVY
jgi:hypothetical protein